MSKLHTTLLCVTGIPVVFLSACKQQEQASADTSAVPNAEEAETLLVSTTKTSSIPDDQPLSFNEHIQPILSASCYHCHGPDSGTRRPDSNPLRLDTEEGAFAKRENGKPVIIKGDPDNSLLVQLMETKNHDEIMPPHPSKDPHGKIMPPEEIALIRRWVKEGAPYEDHWAYIPPKKHELPEIAHKGWAKNPIDYFVANKLENAGLEPNSQEDKARLLRRLTFDLTGLPPSAEEIEKFTSDSRDFETVYSEKVDQLLESDEYAEHFARHWLDVARYADTHGIHIDNYRSIWPYRDWVINAFRKNMPFDQFTREQIAGDMMPNATLEQQIASGFHRCLPTTGEGGAIAEEYNAIYAQDRVDTTAATWLGLTMGCAACHDHKFDAISTKENYEFTAFFRNTTMSALDRNNANHPPNILVPTQADRERLPKLKQELASAKAKYNTYRKDNEPKFISWLNSQKSIENPELVTPNRVLRLTLSDKAKGLTDMNGKEYPSEQPIEWVSGLYGDAVLFSNQNAINLGNAGDFERDQAFSFGAWLKTNHGYSGSPIAKMHTTESHQGYDLWVEKGHLAVHLIHSWPQNYIKVTTAEKFPADQWFHVLVTYDGSSKADGVKIYVNGTEAKVKVNGNKLTDSIKTSAPLLLGKRYNTQEYQNGQLQNFQLFNKELNHDEALALSLEGRLKALKKNAKDNKKTVDQLREYYFSKADSTAAKLHQEVDKLNAEKAAIDKRGTITLVMQEKANAEPFAHILVRGQYANKGEKVTPNTPDSLPAMTDDMPRNRLGLAQWLTDPKNPLPARVTVNRYWYYLFGSGIVETNNDFGVMGARPTHPKLLDWLAVDFVENDWDFHHLLKTIVTSATYRQSAVISDEKLEKDPLNKLLSRGPRYRLDAEQIRDLALSSSGLLHEQIGGPPVKPYQPANIWESVAMKQSNTRHYKQDSGDKLYRRSIYTFWKRTAPFASLEILNAPSREVSCVRRELTNTPLQAFVIMNDPQFVEASRVLATHALKSAKTTQDRIDFIAERLLARPMTTEERSDIEKTLQYATEQFTKSPDKAKALISVGESKVAEDLPAPELAAWTLISNQILNMDETLNK
ncbi:Planctomycete cytochrome C [Rubritalea squalenifaciens DSM 18772]|uniref:Planctomycete cytochrome C n=1 Tax=Rubritalea squalenifaciens DSM 18772 TaxID=1123071 RepID=A0A1M6HCL5_9BACT|nr:DUF1553 domain-containing protein [Rubritalea squalenifaciens]SHJ19896.1 Planctomycete cytochrome C [Rubritalea squalenifaciens DSM 18772]